MRIHRFTSTTLFVWGGLLIYALSFVIVYVFAALACARGFSGSQVFGIRIVPFVTATWAVLAALGMGGIAAVARRREELEPSADEHTRFIRFLAAAASGLALLALGWLVLPTLILDNACAR